MLEKIKKGLTIKNRTVREALAEALGTFLLMFFGIGCVAQVTLGRGEFGKYLSINLAFGIGVTMGIHAAGGISGAHMNASISFTHCVLGNLPWRKLPAYIIGQFLGSFLAASLVFCMYYDALCEYSDGHYIVTGPNGTAGIFATYPAPYMTLLGGFVNEFLATVVLMLCILAIYDKKNNGALQGTQSVITGLLVSVIGMAMGINTGYAINPSRDLPPRIFTAIAGWGIEVFRAGDYWFWVPVVAPTLGSLVGALAYKLLIDFHNQTPLEGGDGKGKDDLQTNQL
ncbi:aquaporin-7-like [Dermochelys coriacea]|uniref:aquaporin-7-like n=1 Tax=Dermochelys coriacea TaxID=27794 RepID=UPI0018E6DFB0|nr:aquaporin-7-like [Dermochelys coriacea]XP_043370951.1 aquaporin-7-like [Dermochelys coriacea]